MANVLMWEKSVEYAFLIRAINAKAAHAIGPLDGNVEEIGDAMFGAACRWVIIEFKGTSADIVSETAKYGAQTDNVLDALAQYNTYRWQATAALKKIAAVEKGPSPDLGELQALRGEHKRLGDLAAEYKKMAKAFQNIAYSDAHDALAERGEKFHFLVYGEKEKKHVKEQHVIGTVQADSAQQSDAPPEVVGEQKLAPTAFDLYMQAYFAKKATAQVIRDFKQILPSKGSAEIGADGPTLAAYLEDLISFKQTGKVSGGRDVNEPNGYEGKAASLVGVDEAGNLVVLPLEHVCGILHVWANKKKAARALKSEP